jgi:hypothetical protein
MSSQIQSALIAAIVVAIGWLVTYYLMLKKERILKSEEIALRFLERQIEELYGPLYGLINESKMIYDVVKMKVPTQNGNVFQEKFTQEHWDIWRYFVEKHFLPHNKEISNLIKTKMHLLNTIELPKSFIAFLDHTVQFELLHNLWKDTGISATNIKGKGWPSSFNTDVNNTLQMLRESHDNYLRRLSSISRK